MADPNTIPESKPAPSRPVSADIEKELRTTIARLQEDLITSQSEVKALHELLAEQEKARADAKAKKAGGPKMPVAMVQILGEGRRTIPIGGALKSSELPGLVEGEHYQFVDA